MEAARTPLASQIQFASPAHEQGRTWDQGGTL